MKRTLFVRLYQPIMITTVVSLLMISAYALLMWVSTRLEHSIPSIAQYAVPLEACAKEVLISAGIVGIGTSGLFTLELASRVKHDYWWNTFRSIQHTINLRRYLRRKESVVITAIGAAPVADNTRVIRSFNRAARKSVIDLRSDSVMVLIKLPLSQQAQEILNSIEPQLKEYLSNDMDGYFFSSATRKKNILVFNGKRR